MSAHACSNSLLIRQLCATEGTNCHNRLRMHCNKHNANGGRRGRQLSINHDCHPRRMCFPNAPVRVYWQFDTTFQLLIYGWMARRIWIRSGFVMRSIQSLASPMQLWPTWNGARILSSVNEVGSNSRLDADLAIIGAANMGLYYATDELQSQTKQTQSHPNDQ